MTDDRLPATRFPTGVFIVLSVLAALVNAALSMFFVVMAIPGSGSPGQGFTIIAATFLVGNIALFAYALLSSRSARKRTQVIGLVLQVLTIPICIGISLLITSLLGITAL